MIYSSAIFAPLARRTYIEPAQLFGADTYGPQGDVYGPVSYAMDRGMKQDLEASLHPFFLCVRPYQANDGVTRNYVLTSIVFCRRTMSSMAG